MMRDCLLSEKKLDERDEKDVSIDTLTELAVLLLKNNISYFNEKSLKQKTVQQLGQSFFYPIVFYLWQN